MSTLKKGFTLIELLVVIAIIGILSAVVLASLNTARDQANDAAVKSQLGQLRSEAELYYNNNNQQYGDGSTSFCNDSSTANSLYNEAIDSGLEGGSSGCDADDTGWHAYVQMSNNEIWCVDSSGYSDSLGVGGSAPSAGELCSGTAW